MRVALQSISDKLTECLSRLRHGWGPGWALLAILVVSLVLLILAARAQARSQDCPEKEEGKK
ncbi:MAG: hypothetical protein JSW47_16210 [Phycisphaerales bacterium]|nr:MAG: hypothetical protein JSW47_16210 [Phycisphaerales bacterium]